MQIRIFSKISGKLAIFFSVVFAVFLVASIVAAATTIGSNISSDGNLTVSGTATSTFVHGITFATSGGNVGIGTSSPKYALDVNGTTQTNDIISKGPEVDVRAFGAKGDGVTNDTAAIQAAIDSISVGTVLFPSGTYKTTAPIITKSNIRLLGVERQASIISFAGTGFAITFADSASYFQIENLTIKANSALATAGISGDHPKFLNLTNVVIDGNMQTGFTTACIYITGDAPNNSYNLFFDKIVTNRCGGDGIKLSGTGAGSIVNIMNSGIHDSAKYGINVPYGGGSGWGLNVANNEIEGNYNGQIYAEATYNSQIVGNYFEPANGSASTPLVLNTISGSYGMVINNNFIDGTSTYGITAGSMFGGSISNNWFQRTTYGINLGGSQDVEVAGNFGGGTTSGVINTSIGTYKNIHYSGEGSTKFITQSGQYATTTFSHGATLATTGGNVGIGTAIPQALLHISKSAAGGEGGYLYLTNAANTTLNNKTGIVFSTEQSSSFAGVREAEISALETNDTGASALLFKTFNGSLFDERVRIDAAGNVGIGTTAPSSTLEIKASSPWFTIGNGSASTTITATATSTFAGAVVATHFFSSNSNTNYPDYVFEPSYNLMPLKDLKSYVAENKHLPNVPSLDEAKGGFDLAGFAVKLLEKIEQAYLYIFQIADSQNQKIADLQRQIDDLKIMCGKK